MFSIAHAAHSHPFFPLAYSYHSRLHAAASASAVFPVDLRPRRTPPSQASEEASEVAHEGSPDGASLRGADVLRALQRAVGVKETALREKRRRKKKQLPTAAAAAEGGDVDLQDGRPIEIRGDWGARIVELEGRIQQLHERYYD